jgi:hypothetical protein
MRYCSLWLLSRCACVTLCVAARAHLQSESAEEDDVMQPASIVSAPPSSPIQAQPASAHDDDEQHQPGSRMDDSAPAEPTSASEPAPRHTAMDTSEDVISNVRGEEKEGTATATTSIPSLPPLQPLPALTRSPSLQAEPQQEATTGHGAEASETESPANSPGRSSMPTSTRVAGGKRGRNDDDEGNKGKRRKGAKGSHGQRIMTVS